MSTVTASMHTPARSMQLVPQPQTVNVGDSERWISAAAGLGLMALGLRRFSLTGLLATGAGASLLYRGLTGHCHLYESLGIDTAEHQEAVAVPAQHGFKIERSVTISRPASELYAYWRDLDHLPHVFQHIRSVTVQDAEKSHWIASGPLGRPIQWDAEIFNERENELIAWRSLPGGDIETAGSVRFRQLGQDRGTEVTVSLKYNPAAGKLGAAVSTLLGSNPAHMLQEDLRRFKQTMETGEVASTDGQPKGDRGLYQAFGGRS